MPAVLLLTAGTLSPGPNNFIVMRAAARGGFLAALPAIAAIVAGSVALLALASGAASGALALSPLLRQAIAIGGGLYLLWLGASLMVTESAQAAATPNGAVALFAFQLLNPKAWTLALTLVAAQTTSTLFEILQRLAPLYAGIATASLAAWAALGSVLRRANLRPVQQRWMERAFGASLALGALLLLL